MSFLRSFGFSLSIVAAALALATTESSGQQPAQRGVHPTPAPSVKAVRLTAPVNLDGNLNEAVWQTPLPATDFRQSQPDEGKQATQKTEVRFAFDDDALYIGARMYDTEGAKGVRTRLMRRDAMTENDSDLLIFFIDSYHAHQSTFNFWVNPSNSRRDGIGDPTWDAVWESATKIDSLGWTAELRIPYSQLNFSVAKNQTWGVQIIRFSHRLNERSHFAWWANNESGGPQRYGHLEAIEINDRPKGAELLPYIVGRSRYIRPADATNPFTKSNDTDYRIGGDLKYRLTSNLTLNATFNPDFGQVEVDPAVVNLSAFETFFQERRPFFIEGQNAFSFGSFSCFFCSNVSNLQMFYSRRLGRAPQIFPSATYVDQPENATILAAGKVTGRTANNVLVGMLDAVTRRETARTIRSVNGALVESTAEVEPLTNYFVFRPRKEFQGGTHSVGLIATSVDRFSSDSLVDARLSSSARELGFDWFTSRKNRQYTFFGQYALSDVHGSAAAINRLQRSSARYFQRPDKEPAENGFFSNSYDPAAQKLRGYAGYARVAKESGTYLGEAMVNYRSPGFETNDISFLDRADYVFMNSNLAKSVTKPGKIFRNYFATLSAQQQFNYDGDLNDREFAAGMFTQLRNFWGANAFVIRSPEVFDERISRGGPVLRTFGYWYFSTSWNTDARRKISFSTSPAYRVREHEEDNYQVNLNVTYKPSSNVQLSVGPQYVRNWSPAQFVTSGADSTAKSFFGRRYIFAGLRQRQFAMSTRANVTFTPALTLEVFAQPLIVAADYTKFREFVAPRQSALHDFTPAQISSMQVGGSTRYTIDADGAGPAQPISFFNPTFNFRSLRGNAVMRWEYKPGSTLFFVWQQSRSGTAAVGDFNFSRDREALFSAHPDNIFLVKATYWISL
ncbi:MAG: carbohydrate binding family 9 domain-containing protein [Gemmatimonadaceae bacterium]|nr:carbohydrate binding family 9 domain-containing protein [Gemmatimonadaceae bacterium]